MGETIDLKMRLGQQILAAFKISSHRLSFLFPLSYVENQRRVQQRVICIESEACTVEGHMQGREEY